MRRGKVVVAREGVARAAERVRVRGAALDDAEYLLRGVGERAFPSTQHTHIGKGRPGEGGGEDAPVERMGYVGGGERGGEGGGGLEQSAGVLHRHRMRGGGRGEASWGTQPSPARNMYPRRGKPRAELAGPWASQGVTA